MLKRNPNVRKKNVNTKKDAGIKKYSGMPLI